MTDVVIIADDLTGALDTASPFACAGRGTRVFTGLEVSSLECAKEASVVAFSTNSRSADREQARRAARQAAELALQLEPRLVLKKVDSRLKGNVVAECEAVAKVFGCTNLLIAPAAPDVGRYVRNGHVVGHGVAGAISVHERFADCGLPMHVMDAESPADLDRIARVLEQKREALIVCTRGLAQALANTMALSRSEPLRAKFPALIAIGSRDPITLAQVEKLRRAGNFDLLPAPHGHVAPPLDMPARLLVLVRGEVPEDPVTVARNFARGVAGLCAAMQPASLLLCGGDTAEAFFQATGIGALKVGGEAAPGLPWSSVMLNGKSTTVICKSGGFGSDTTLLEIFP